MLRALPIVASLAKKLLSNPKKYQILGRDTQHTHRLDPTVRFSLVRRVVEDFDEIAGCVGFDKKKLPDHSTLLENI